MRFAIPSPSSLRVALLVGVAWGFSVAAGASGATTAPAMDPAQLPPAASREVSFENDIRPILEHSCLRCHGAEKPKGKFRLDDRDAALKGGENGPDIVPGNSGKSPLSYYVARVFPEMEMPPEGKGDPLTAEEVGLLRAWIDSGLSYASTNASASSMWVTLSPAFGWVHVSGDQKKFREQEWMREDWNAGLEKFYARDRVSSETTFTVEGHALRDDYAFALTLEKNSFGFIRGGFSQFRRYYDDTGGYYDFLNPPSRDLNRDLHLEVGRAWIDLGFTLFDPGRIVLGYEYQFRDGSKSTLEWGNFGGLGGIQGVGGKNLYPAAKDIDERVHILKLDLTHNIGGWEIEDNARVEFFDLRTTRRTVESFTFGPEPQSLVHTKESAGHVQGINTLRAEKQINDWLFLAGGYLYSRLEGDASFDQVTLDNASIPAPGTFWYSDFINLQQRTHSFSLSGLITPGDNLAISAGVQNEWTHQEGMGRVHLDEGDPYDPAGFVLEAPTLDSNLDKRQVAESLMVRYSGIPYTTVYAEGRLSQQRVSEVEQESEGSERFDRDTDAAMDRRDVRLGFTISPWQRLSLSASARKRDTDNDYRHRTDASDLGGAGYPAFIRSRDSEGNELQTKLVLKLAPRWRAQLGYRLALVDYETETDGIAGLVRGGEVLAATHESKTYSLGTTWVPTPRLHLSTTVSMSDVRTDAERNNHPSLIAYRSLVYTLMSSGTLALNEKTGLHASYYYSSSDFKENPASDAVPLGLDYVRHGLIAGVKRELTPKVTAHLRYGFFLYDEPTARRDQGYTAHGVFASMRVIWP